ncbi:MAG TPA: hypothetical protein VHP83_01575 [Aggregatilineaceae bacterium]|nr:hypothetical protein [Aggregatilineaceae bacterium]
MYRRYLALIVTVLLLAQPLALAHGQDGGWTPEEQAALDDVAAAFANFMALDSYTANVAQDVEQYMEIPMMGSDSITTTTTIDTAGTIEAGQPAIDNQHLVMTEKITQESGGTGASAPMVVGPIDLEMIVVNDRIYLKMALPEELSGYYPEDWQDITEGADMYPGMEMFDFKAMLELSGNFGEDYVNNLMNATTGIEILGQSDLDGRTVNRYRLTLDIQKALETIGASSLESMFNNTDQMPFDVGLFIDLIYGSENTTYTIELAVGADDQLLYSFVQTMYFDVVLTSDVITDPRLAGYTINFNQNYMQSIKLQTMNEPVNITAPPLAE